MRLLRWTVVIFGGGFGGRAGLSWGMGMGEVGGNIGGGLRGQECRGVAGKSWEWWVGSLICALWCGVQSPCKKFSRKKG